MLGLDEGEGLLTGRLLTVEGDDRGGRSRRVDLVRPGAWDSPLAWAGPGEGVGGEQDRPVERDRPAERDEPVERARPVPVRVAG